LNSRSASRGRDSLDGPRLQYRSCDTLRRPHQMTDAHHDRLSLQSTLAELYIQNELRRGRRKQPRSLGYFLTPLCGSLVALESRATNEPQSGEIGRAHV